MSFFPPGPREKKREKKGFKKQKKVFLPHVIKSRVDPPRARRPRRLLGLVARDLDADGVGVADEAAAGVVVSDEGGVSVSRFFFFRFFSPTARGELGALCLLISFRSAASSASFFIPLTLQNQLTGA